MYSLRYMFLVLAAFTLPAHALPDLSTPMPNGSNAVIVIDTTPPDKTVFPPAGALVPETSFIVMQAKGGSILLGPLLGAANIKANSRKLAQKSVGGYMGADVLGLATVSLAVLGITADAKPDSYMLKPFAYVQQCGDDETYRVAIAYNVTAPGGKKAWTNRYVVHLPTAIPYDRFLNPTPEQIEAFNAELTSAADAATALLARDMRGELPATGRKVSFGSLHILGNKMGGLGIYTPASQLYMQKTELIDESDGNVIVRMRAPSAFFYGVHMLQRTMVHTLNDAK
jgi:hypothetical protein